MLSLECLQIGLPTARLAYIAKKMQESVGRGSKQLLLGERIRINKKKSLVMNVSYLRSVPQLYYLGST